MFSGSVPRARRTLGRGTSRLALAGALAAGALASARPAAAQGAVVDQGSFARSVHGRPAGREEFVIHALPGGGFRARATLVDGGRREATTLETTAAGLPLLYERERHEGGALRERLAAQTTRGRLALRTTTARGDAAREYLLAEDAVLVDEAAAHQHWWLVRADAPATRRLIEPGSGARVVVRIRELGREPLRLGDSTVTARRLALDGFPDGVHELWTDDAGRVLRLAVPGTGLVAVRERVPGRR